IYKTLNTIEKELGDRRFLRCHQSFLVNMDHIRQIDKQFLLSNGDIVPIRQRGVKPVRQAYIDYTASKSAGL
ncbi:LytTR family DNA-binding domain-containing protein, partial [Evtepia sp.]|uniref:LytTR family DNA-binding domain-containing protein n=1 Tax=Evtepia sp. TaxID=2773933 RepID=UPI002A830FAE